MHMTDPHTLFRIINAVSRRSVFVWGSIGLFSLFVSAAAADRICLKNNETVEGTVTRETGEAVFIDIGAGNIVFTQDEVDRIEYEPTQAAPLPADLTETTGKSTSAKVPMPPSFLEYTYAQLRALRSARQELAAAYRARRDLSNQCSARKITYFHSSFLEEEKRKDAAEALATGDTEANRTLLIEMSTHRAKRYYALRDIQEAFIRCIASGTALAHAAEETYAAQSRCTEQMLALTKVNIPPEDAYYAADIQKESVTVMQPMTIRTLPYAEEAAGYVVEVTFDASRTARMCIALDEPLVVLSPAFVEAGYAPPVLPKQGMRRLFCRLIRCRLYRSGAP